jgi:hypothetical protein
MMRNGVKILCLFIFLAAFSGAALAQSFNTTGNPADTASGTDITAYATTETLNYVDPDNTAMPEVNPPGDDTHSVGSEYGYSGPGSPVDLTVTPGDTADHYYAVTHEGNVDDSSFTLKSRFNEFGGAAGWLVEFYTGESYTFLKTLEAGVTTTEAYTMYDDDHMPFQYKVIVSSEVAGAPNGSYITVYSTLETANSPTGLYTGGNAYTYAGWGIASDEVTDEVAAPILTLTRTSTIDAPKVYTGGHYDAVPGAIITFTITYTNEGGASAESVVLVDRIPNFDLGYTRLAHVNTNGDTTNVDIEAAQGDATGWTVKYSTLAGPDKTYGYNTGWTLIGTLSAGNEEFPGGGATYTDAGGGAYGAQWIKWEKQYVDSAEDDKSLTWGVTIR